MCKNDFFTMQIILETKNVFFSKWYSIEYEISTYISRGPWKNVFDLQSLTVKHVHGISDAREETKQNKENSAFRLPL